MFLPEDFDKTAVVDAEAFDARKVPSFETPRPSTLGKYRRLKRRGF